MQLYPEVAPNVDYFNQHPPEEYYMHMEPVVQAISAASNLGMLHLMSGLCPQPGCFDLSMSLSSLIKLTSLTISDGYVFPSTLPVIASLSQLRSLSLTYMINGVRDVSFLPTIASSLVRLTNLDVSGSHFLYGDGSLLSVLRSLTDLQQLRLEVANINGRQLSALDGLPVTAIHIDMGLNRLSTISSWLRPRLRDKLECVELSDSQMYDRTCIEGSALVDLSPVLLSAGPQFRSLGLNVIDPCPLVSRLSGMTQLTELALTEGYINEATMRSLSALVGLRQLILTESSVDAEWAEGAVLEVAGALRKLTRLSLWGYDDNDDSAVSPTILEGLGSRVVKQDRNILYLREVK